MILACRKLLFRPEKNHELGGVTEEGFSADWHYALIRAEGKNQQNPNNKTGGETRPWGNHKNPFKSPKGLFTRWGREELPLRCLGVWESGIDSLGCYLNSAEFRLSR